jgi:hypothetical protein
MDAQLVRGSLAPMSDETLSFTNGSVLLRWFIVEDLLEVCRISPWSKV